MFCFVRELLPLSLPLTVAAVMQDEPVKSLRERLRKHMKVEEKIFAKWRVGRGTKNYTRGTFEPFKDDDALVNLHPFHADYYLALDHPDRTRKSLFAERAIKIHN